MDKSGDKNHAQKFRNQSPIFYTYIRAKILKPEVLFTDYVYAKIFKPEVHVKIPKPDLHKNLETTPVKNLETRGGKISKNFSKTY